MTNRLDDCCQLWGLRVPRLLAETPTSRVYVAARGGDQVALKLLTPLGAQDESGGALALRHYGGIGAVRLLAAERDAHLLEYVSGEDLIGMAAHADDQATAIIAGVLNQLHAKRSTPFPAGLMSLRVHFRDLFARANADRQAGSDSLIGRGAAVAESLLASPRDQTVLHGDIHHGNIRRHPQRGWLAFDPKGLIGERAFDAANTLLNPMELPALAEDESRLLRRAYILSESMGVPRGRVIAFAFAYACLSASWFLGDGVEPAHEFRVAEIAERNLE